MRQSLARYSAPVSFVHAPSLADFITTIVGFKVFGTHTLLPKSARVFVPLVKHFGYSYQEEHRFCWQPHVRATKLSHVDLEIGSLDRIAELITL